MRKHTLAQCGLWAGLMAWSAMPTGWAAAEQPAAAAEALAVDGLALLRAWVPPVYPKAELKAKHGGMVNVRLIVDETGKVTAVRALEDSDEAFVESALAAVRAWGFAPALDAGKPIACCMDTLVTFSPRVGQEKPSVHVPDQRFNAAPHEGPEIVSSPSAPYPTMLEERKLPGKMRFTCLVTPEGKASQARPLIASHVDFVLPAIAGLDRWEFKPARQGDLAVAGPVEGEVSFDFLWGKAAETLEANGISGPEGGAVPGGAPMPVFVVDPVWPLERQLQGEAGSATVEFRVNELGLVRDVKVREASAPEFGEALRAAVEMWAFEKPYEEGRVFSVNLVKREEFKPEAVPAAVTRVLEAWRRGEIGAAKGLDEKLTPIYRVAPIYPAALKAAGGPKGTAQVEFVIDREGRVRLPRVVAASAPEFGWAAATAVSQWIFRTPRRGGEAVDVKVRLPMEFAAPVE